MLISSDRIFECSKRACSSCLDLLCKNLEKKYSGAGRDEHIWRYRPKILIRLEKKKNKQKCLKILKFILIVASTKNCDGTDTWDASQKHWPVLKKMRIKRTFLTCRTCIVILLWWLWVCVQSRDWDGTNFPSHFSLAYNFAKSSNHSSIIMNNVMNYFGYFVCSCYVLYYLSQLGCWIYMALD